MKPRDPVGDRVEQRQPGHDLARRVLAIVPAHDRVTVDAPRDAAAREQHLHHPRVQDVTCELPVGAAHAERAVEILALQLDVAEPERVRDLAEESLMLDLEHGQRAGSSTPQTPYRCVVVCR